MPSVSLIRKLLLGVFALIAVFAILLFTIGHKQISWHFCDTGAPVSPEFTTPPFLPGNILEQTVHIPATQLDSLQLTLSPKNPKIEPAPFRITLFDSSTGESLRSATVRPEDYTAPQTVRLSFSPPVPLSKPRVRLCIDSPSATPADAPTLPCGSAIRLSRSFVKKGGPDACATFDGVPLSGSLCFVAAGSTPRLLVKLYWPLFAVFSLLYAAFSAWLLRCHRTRRPNLFIGLVIAAQRYRFLISQLVVRDFKTRYKRSVLGVFWSLLNPLLTMSVQYFVFSFLFRSTIQNYPLYLITGIVFFGFFRAAEDQCLTAITDNTALITKVYIPKYIFPVTRAFSALVNFFFSLVPLFAVMLLTGAWPTPALLFLPYAILCLFFFILGVGFFFSALMVFFRDIQFLWGIISLLWLYMTPIFYPVSIIPPQFRPLYDLNPFVHFIGFARTILIHGTTPDPRAFALCALCAAVPFLLGAAFFKRTQKHFILHL
jgi:ABC-2 type transport system permease protein